MGELVRRLEYERRSRSNALLTDRSSQRKGISKEYSTAVRSANAMEDRKKDLYVRRNDIHKRIFLNRFEYEKKITMQFKSDLDFKSQEFCEDKFQTLRRAQSAGAYLETFTGRKKKRRRKHKVSELVPRKYYKDFDGSESSDSACGFGGESNASVSGETQQVKSVSSGLFGLISKAKYVHHGREIANSANEMQNESGNKISSDESELADSSSTDDNRNPKNKTSRREPPAVTARAKSAMTGAMFKASNIINVNPRALSANGSRRSSLPGATDTALIPRDLKLTRRRSSVSGTSCDDDDVTDHMDSSRSYRLLREAFQKVKIEPIDPSKERFESIKEHNKSESKVLTDKSMDKFNDIFVQDLFFSLNPSEEKETNPSF